MVISIFSTYPSKVWLICRDLAGCFLQACEDHDLVKVKACIELGLSVNILSKDKKKSGEEFARNFLAISIYNKGCGLLLRGITQNCWSFFLVSQTSTWTSPPLEVEPGPNTGQFSCRWELTPETWDSLSPPYRPVSSATITLCGDFVRWKISTATSWTTTATPPCCSQCGITMLREAILLDIFIFQPTGLPVHFENPSHQLFERYQATYHCWGGGDTQDSEC